MPANNDIANGFLGETFAQTTSIPAATELWAAVGTITNGVFAEHPAKHNYARKLVAVKGEPYPSVFSTPSGRAIWNKEEFNFQKALGGNWDPVNAIAFYSAKTGGSPRFQANLTLTAQEQAAGGVLCEEGAALFFEAGAFRAEMSDTDLEIDA